MDYTVHGVTAKSWTRLSDFQFQTGNLGFPGGSVVKNLPIMQEIRVQSLGQEDPLVKKVATHSSILAWEIIWTEDLGGLQFTGSQKSWTGLSKWRTRTNRKIKRVNPKNSYQEKCCHFSFLFPFHCVYLKRWMLVEPIVVIISQYV